MVWWPVIVGSTGALGLFTLMGRWIIRVERGFSEQQTVNAKHIAALELLAAKLEHHAEMDDLRFAAPVARRKRRR